MPALGSRDAGTAAGTPGGSRPQAVVGTSLTESDGTLCACHASLRPRPLRGGSSHPLLCSRCSFLFLTECRGSFASVCVRFSASWAGTAVAGRGLSFHSVDSVSATTEGLNSHAVECTHFLHSSCCLCLAEKVLCECISGLFRPASPSVCLSPSRCFASSHGPSIVSES